eukprot:1699039-Rhodomonas_salina.3
MANCSTGTPTIVARQRIRLGTRIAHQTGSATRRAKTRRAKASEDGVGLHLPTIAKQVRIRKDSCLVQVFEELFPGVLGQLLVCLEILRGHQPVAVHPLRLVQEERGKLGRIREEGGIAHENALEYVGEMADGKLVVEVAR